MEIYLAAGLHGWRPELGWLSALLTYSLHATLWAGVVTLLVRLRSASFALQHAAWKLALLAPLATTCLTLSVPSSFERSLRGAAHAPQFALLSLKAAPPPATSVSSGESKAASFGSLLDFSAACLLLGLALGVARFTSLAYAQYRALALRRRVVDARLLARLERLVERLALREVRLTESANIASPLVLGAHEICIPFATLSALDDAEVDAVLAHELAHLERGDGLWFPLLNALQAPLWFHPITRWVGARLRTSAELACDERCLELTGEPLALARALTRIAAQALSSERAVVAPTMTQPRSSLVARVAELTREAVRVRSRVGWQSRIGLAASVALVALLCVGSSVRVAEARLEPTLALPSPAVPTPGPTIEVSLMSSRNNTGFARRTRALEAERTRLTTRSTDPGAGEDPAVRLLEIEQELRHERQMQAFVEAGAALGQ